MEQNADGVLKLSPLFEFLVFSQAWVSFWPKDFGSGAGRRPADLFLKCCSDELSLCRWVLCVSDWLAGYMFIRVLQFDQCSIYSRPAHVLAESAVDSLCVLYICYYFESRISCTDEHVESVSVHRHLTVSNIPCNFWTWSFVSTSGWRSFRVHCRALCT